MKTETIKKIIEYFTENEELFNTCIEELDGWNGYLGDDRYYYMDELNEFYRGTSPLDLLERVYYGGDDDSWTMDSNGNKIYGEFNPNREFFRYNGYGNLVSSDYKDYSAHLDSYAIEEMSEKRSHIDTIENDEKLTALFDELENDESEEN